MWQQLYFTIAVDRRRFSFTVEPVHTRVFAIYKIQKPCLAIDLRFADDLICLGDFFILYVNLQPIGVEVEKLIKDLDKYSFLWGPDHLRDFLNHSHWNQIALNASRGHSNTCSDSMRCSYRLDQCWRAFEIGTMEELLSFFQNQLLVF